MIKKESFWVRWVADTTVAVDVKDAVVVVEDVICCYEIPQWRGRIC